MMGKTTYYSTGYVAKNTGYRIDEIQQFCRDGVIKAYRPTENCPYRITKRAYEEFKKEYGLLDSKTNTNKIESKQQSQYPRVKSNININDKNSHGTHLAVLPQNDWSKTIHEHELKRFIDFQFDATALSIYAALTQEGDLYNDIHYLNQNDIADHFGISQSEISSYLINMEYADIIKKVQNGTHHQPSGYRVIKPNNLPNDYQTDNTNISPSPTITTVAEKSEVITVQEFSDTQEYDINGVKKVSTTIGELYQEITDKLSLMDKLLNYRSITDKTKGTTLDNVYSTVNDCYKLLKSYAGTVKTIDNYKYTLLYMQGYTEPAIFDAPKNQTSELCDTGEI